MDKYKIFNEGLKSSFNDYQAIIGVNVAKDFHYGLCFADVSHILSYYEEHGILISKVRSLNEERNAILERKIGESSANYLYVNEPEIIFDKKVLKELDLSNGLDSINSEQTFICDIIKYADKEIDCGIDPNGHQITKKYDGKESLDYILFDKGWKNKLDYDSIIVFCVEQNKKEYIDYFVKNIKNLDLTDALTRAASILNMDIADYIMEREDIHSILPSMMTNEVGVSAKTKLLREAIKDPLKMISDIHQHIQYENQGLLERRQRYEYER